MSVDVFNWSFLTSVSLLVPLPCSFYYCSSVVQDGIRASNISCSPFIQDCFNYPGVFMFPYETENCPFEFPGDLCWNFGGHITFARMAIFTVLILPIHDHGRSFYLLIFNFFLIVLKFLL